MDPLLPNENSQVPAGHKVVSLIRHGQATHNYVRDVTHDVKHYLDEAFTDCPLTDLGFSQCRNFQTRPPKTELLLASPLERTLQTASTIFEPQIGAGIIGVGKEVPFIALEAIREVAGKHYPDKRYPISEKSKKYPAVDFSFIPTDEDVLWRPEEREPMLSVNSRIREFLTWISKRSETYITVVTHHAFLRGLYVFVTEAEQVFANCEMRTMTIDPEQILANRT